MHAFNSVDLPQLLKFKFAFHVENIPQFIVLLFIVQLFKMYRKGVITS